MIKIKNIYHMLSYAYKALQKTGYERLKVEEFEHISDLFAAILAKGVSNQIKRGLGKNYTDKTVSLPSPRGKINMALSIKRQTVINKHLACSIDEYTENTYMNQILKTTMLLLLKTDEVSLRNKNKLKKIRFYFSNVEEINHHKIQWSSIKYHRNNANYELLINICYFIITGLLLTERKGKHKLSGYMDNQKMHRLFEKFVLEYYRKNFPQFNASSAHINWNTDDDNIDFLPIMKTDITLQYGEKILIIDTKYYEHSMQVNQYNDNSNFHSHNLYQIFSYVKNKDYTDSGNVGGVLLYAKTDEKIVPNNAFLLSGNRIAVKTLDMNMDFKDIEKQLENLAREFLIN